MARYWFLLRPPFVGTHPQGSIEQRAVYPSENCKLGGGEMQVTHGWVVYPWALDREQVWKYDLLPDDPAERALYRMWLECDRDDLKTVDMLAEYSALGRAVLAERAEWNDIARITLDWLNATK